MYRMVQWRCAVTVGIQNGTVTVCCDCRCTEWYSDGVLWLSVYNNFALSNLKHLAAHLRCLFLNFHCLCIYSSTCFCRNMCLPRRPSDSLKNCLFQPDRSVHVYSLYGNETQLWLRVYILLQKVCCVWLLVVFPFPFCNFPSQSVKSKVTIFYIVKISRRLLQFHIYTQLTNIKPQTQFFTTVTLLQFCVSKSLPFIVT